MHSSCFRKIRMAVLSLAVLGMLGASVFSIRSHAGIITMAQLNDFSDRAKVTMTDFKHNWNTGLYTGTVNIKNVHTSLIEGTLVVALNQLTNGVSQTNADGLINGDPYTLVFGGLNANDTVTVRVSFINPGNAAIFFTPVVYQLINGAVNARAMRALSRPFTIAAIPDTQFYARDGLVEFEKQVEWVLANASDWNIGFVVHLGDIVDDGDDEDQWANAMDALDPLLDQSDLPFFIIRGNHDEPAFYLDNIPPESMQGKHWFIDADPTGMTQAQVFRVEDACILHIGFQNDPTASELAWANALLARPEIEGLPVIVSTHDYIDGGGQSPAGRYIWKKFIRKNPMVFMVLNGHSSTEYALVSRNAENLPVYQLLSDYQGGNGLMRLVTIDPNRSKIFVRTFSPFFRIEEDRPADLNYFETDSNSQFEYDVNIRERLAFDTAFHFDDTSLQPLLTKRDFMQTGRGYSQGFQNQPQSAIRNALPTLKEGLRISENDADSNFGR